MWESSEEHAPFQAPYMRHRAFTVEGDALSLSLSLALSLCLSLSLLIFCSIYPCLTWLRLIIVEQDGPNPILVIDAPMLLFSVQRFPIETE